MKADLGYISPKEEPNTQYELLRRRIYSNVHEMWYFIHAGLLDIQKQATDIAPDIVDSVKYLLSLGAEHKRYIDV